MTTYFIPAQTRANIQFFDSFDELADPVYVYVQVTSPSGKVAFHGYGALGAVIDDVVRDGVGTYHLDIAFDEGGVWTLLAIGPGIAPAPIAVEQVVQVKAVSCGLFLPAV